MKKLIKFLIILILLVFTIGAIIKIDKPNENNISDTEKNEIISYINDIYNIHRSIPEFEDINKTDELWIWDNINQYLCNHSEFEERNQYCDYSYEEISSFAKILYGNDFTLETPVQNPAMIYDSETNKYGVPMYNVESLRECQIENIEKSGNIYTINIIDYVISFIPPLNNTSEEELIYFHNITDFDLNPTSADIVFKLTELKNYKEKVLKNKDKFTSKTIILEYNETLKQYYIKSCKYNYSNIDIIRTKYSQMLETFNFYNLEYNENDFNTSTYAEITNFDEISSIYTENGLNIYKNTFKLLNFKDDKVFIEADDFYFLDNIFITEFSDIQKNENELTCTVSSTLFNSSEEFTLNSKPFITTFKLVKENNEWKIDEFSIDFYE